MVEVKGWVRTLLLAVGAFAGVLGVAALIHILKKRGIITES